MTPVQRVTAALILAALAASCGSGGEDVSDSSLAADLRAAEGGAAPAASVEVRSPAVALDFGGRQMEIRATLVNAGPARPDTVWLWAYFVHSSSPGGSWSDQPIAVAAPFAAGDTAPAVARGGFHWATNSRVPRRGYLARVSASAQSADAAQVPTPQRDYGIEGAVPVKVRQ